MLLYGVWFDEAIAIKIKVQVAQNTNAHLDLEWLIEMKELYLLRNKIGNSRQSRFASI
jgi:hypothetical protein